MRKVEKRYITKRKHEILVLDYRETVIHIRYTSNVKDKRT